MEVFNMDQDQLNSNVMSTYEPSPTSSNSVRSRSLDGCENCRRSVRTMNNNGPPPRVISSCVTTATQDCTCRTSSSGVTTTSPSRGDAFENRTGFGDTNNSRPSPSRAVMSLTNSGGVRLPSSSTTITQDQQHLRVGSSTCPHLLNSPEGVGVPISSNLNCQTNFCQACGPTVSSNPPENVTLSSQDLLLASSSSSSSPPQSTGPIPIPSRTNRHLRPHHHHHFSSSLSSSPQGLGEDHSASSSPPGPTMFSSSCSSAGWKFRERSSGNTSGYSSSEPGHIPAFFPQQSPKYFKQPSSSQDYATKYPGSDKPSMIDQWPRSPSRRIISSSSNRSSAQTTFSRTGRGELSSGFAARRRGQAVSHSSGGPSRKDSNSQAATRSRVGEEEAPLDIGEYCRLPHELLNQLHELEHQNEDLSADVVFSLEKKGYNIHEILGKGISSTVRRVTEKQTGKEYAVKIIDISGEKCETAAVEQTKRDTFREIRILRMCGGHPNIIELHDVFETPTFIFLVFEICKQGELFDYLTSVVSLSEKKTRFFMRQLMEAVYYCHEKNIVHRDLKPENILLDDDLNIKVSDFGFATVVEPKEELSELCGTPGYLAPEVLAHSMYENVPGYGKEVDMWACGVIMYTLLCGAPPFWNRRQMMMLRAIMNADYSFNSPEWDDISDPPKNLIEKLLVVNPKERLTAKEALNHPFFHSQIQDQKRFNARRKFRGAVFCVLFYTRLNFYFKHPPPISVKTISTNPYSVKIMRKIIDSCAFGMYRHWVKRVDNQNRAALFEHTLREDWKHGLITNSGSWNNVQSH